MDIMKTRNECDKPNQTTRHLPHRRAAPHKSESVDIRSPAGEVSQREFEKLA